MASSPLPSEVVIVGMGLIGGSLGLALRRRGVRVCGIERNPAALRHARRRGAASRTASSISVGAARARLVVLAVPIQDMPGCLRQLSAHAPPDTVVTDTASVKLPILKLVKDILVRPERFVGAHPMAGSERGGPAAASPFLLKGRPCVIIAGPRTNRAARLAAEGIFRACGARIVRMDARRHDRAAALVSHLPHAIANILVCQALASREARRLVSGSFLDATRVTLSPERLWEGIFRANSRELKLAISSFSRSLRGFGSMASGISGAHLRRCLSRVRRARGRLSANNRRCGRPE